MSRPEMLSLLLVFFLSVSWEAASTDLAIETFLQCLLILSYPSHPISNAIYTSNNGSYSSVLQSYIRNLRFNMSTTPKPLLILSAMHESHVEAAIICARKHNLNMKIRSGGHDYEGVSYVSGSPFFLLDMFNLRAIDVDAANEVAWVQTGATLGEVYNTIAEKCKGYGFPAGVCPTVGVGGHFSGGGYGNTMRKYGLSVDNVIDAKIVDVNGRLLDRKSMGEDLFWAITGGGGSSFGVVLAYKIKIVRVPEMVTVFRVQRTVDQNGLPLDILEQWQQVAYNILEQWQQVAYNIDDDLYIRTDMDVVSSTTRIGEKTVRTTFLALFLGGSKRLLSIMNASFPKLGLLRSDCIEMSWLESVLFWANFPLGTPADALLSRTPQALNYLKIKSDYVRNPIPRDGLEGMWKKMVELQAPQLSFNPYGGKMWEIPSTAKPFPHRAGNLWNIQYETNWNEDGEEAANYYIDLTRQLYNHMTPFVSKNPRQAFLNYRDLDLGTNHHGKKSYLEGSVYGIQYFKENFDRLVEIKTKVDPCNFFRNEQSIPPLPYSLILTRCLLLN